MDVFNITSVAAPRSNGFFFTPNMAMGYYDGNTVTLLVNTINQIERSPVWWDTAIIITWDDSDGWYDQVMLPIVNPSHDANNDALFGAACAAL